MCFITHSCLLFCRLCMLACKIVILNVPFHFIFSIKPIYNYKKKYIIHIQNYALRRISCHGRNHSQASCEYSLTIFLCCQHHSEYSLLGSKFSTNLLFAASKCHVTIQRRGSSRCSKWPNRRGWLQW